MRTRRLRLIKTSRFRSIVKSVPWLACGVIAGSAMACAAWAQPASPPAIAVQKVSLPVAIDAAWQRALSAREVDGQRRRAQAEQTAAGSLWAAPPSLWLGYRDDRIDANKSARETEVALSWPLWLPGQRSARAAAAGAEMSLAEPVAAPRAGASPARCARPRGC